MDILANLLMGFSLALSPSNLLFCFIGAILGTLVGIMPGLGPVQALVILFPLLAGMNPTAAVIMMAGIYYGAMYGGSTTSILLNVPGESSSVVTCLDGYAMAKQGRAGAALGMAAIASFVAGTFSVLGLTLLAPPLADFAVSFGPPEYFTLMLLGMTTVVLLTGKSMVKGLTTATFGLLVATVGIDPISGASRFTFKQIELLDGIDFIVVASGLFAIGEVLYNAERIVSSSLFKTPRRLAELLPTARDLVGSIGTLVRSSIIGFLVGVLPGAGATIASFMAYGVEQRVSKHPERFGTGIVQGVAAPEAANNAAAAGALVPLLTLGIPGSGTAAIMLGAFMMYGLRPGPLLFKEHPDFVWPVIASMYLGNLMLLVFNLPLVPLFASLLRLPYYYIYPLVIVVSMVGIYSLHNSIYDLWLLAGFGVLGYLLRKFEYPLAPAVLAMVLGPLAERALRQSMVMSHGSLAIFVDRPVSAVLTVSALALLAYGLLTTAKGTSRAPAPSSEGES